MDRIHLTHDRAKYGLLWTRSWTCSWTSWRTISFSRRPILCGGCQRHALRLGYLILSSGYTTCMASNSRAISTQGWRGGRPKLETAGRGLFHHINLSLRCAPRESTQGSRGIATVIIDLGEWTAARACQFTQWKRTSSTLWLGNWVGPKACLDVLNKRTISFHNRQLNPRLFSPQPSHYVAKKKKQNQH